METLSSFASKIHPPLTTDDIFKDDCMYCFLTCFDDQGLNVCLHCFKSFCSVHDDDHHNAFPDHQIYLNYKKQLKPQEELQSKPTKIAKLEIKEKTEDEIFDLHTKIYNINTNQLIDYVQNELPMSISMTVNLILKARSSEKKEEIKAWEQEITPCPHSFDISQTPIEDLRLHQCANCDLKENLWICLQCGTIGCGREQFGGVPGNSHAKQHYEETQHPIAVKLGSLTSDSADVYCYQCNDEIKVPELSKLLQTFNINVNNFEKTEKSLTELQLEQNLKWDFNMDGSNGELLQPVYGPKLSGFKNLGNSCYLASVLQVLFSFKKFENEFYGKDFDFASTSPQNDVQTQLIKVANGLISGVYAIPDESTTDTIKYQKGIKPSGFKSLIGKDHPEFGSLKQQDAFEFWNFLLEKIDALYSNSINDNPANIFKFVVEDKLASDGGKIKLKSELSSSISLPISVEVLSVDEEGHKNYKPISLESMFQKWHSQELVELSGKQLNKVSGFKTFPEVLVIHAQRIQLENWVPVKVEVPIEFPDSLDLSSYVSEGKLDNEILIEEDEEQESNKWTPNAQAMETIQAMGFPEVRCTKALYNTGNISADDAMNWLFLHMDDLDIDDPFIVPTESDPALEAAPPQDLIEQIVAMGFTEKLAIKSLVLNNNNPEIAVSWIFENLDDDGSLPQQSIAKKISDADIVGNLISKLPTFTKYSLHSIICHKGTSVHSGHYVCYIKKLVAGETRWVLFNDEKVVIGDDSNLKELESSGYMYIYVRDDVNE